MRRVACSTALATALVLVLMAAGVVRADGVIRNGLGARVAGRGGVNIAFADSGTILHDNPAGMVNIESCELAELGIDVLITDIRYRDARRFASSDHDPVPLGDLAFIHKSPDGRMAVGLGLFSPGGFATDYTMPGPEALGGGVVKYESFGSLARALAGVAWQADDRLSLGASLGVGISHKELEGPYFSQGPSLPPGLPMIMDMQATGAALSWSLGLQYRLSCATTLGLAYQGDTNFNLDGHTSVMVPQLGVSSYDSTLNARWPMNLGLGLRHEYCRHWIFGADVVWYDWSSAFDDFGLEARNPSNPLFEFLLGPNVTEVLPLRWRDSVSIRLGGERWFDDGRVFRGGYVYHRNPIPDETLTPYLNTTLEHTVALGCGRQLSGGWEVDLAYQFMFGPKNTIEQSDLAGGDFSGAEILVQAHLIYFGAVRRF